MSSNRIVCLPGFGFKADIFYGLRLPYKNILSLNWAELRPINLDRVTEYLAENIQDDSIIMAWSLGGIYALNLINHYPLKCRKLILINTTPKLLADDNWPGISLLEAQLFKEKISVNFNYFLALVQFPNKELGIRKILAENLYLNKCNRVSMLLYLELLFSADLKKGYDTLKVKTLHILGDCDPLVKIEAFKNENNPNVKINLIKGAGHIPFLTHPRKFLIAVQSFIDE